ncbi:hypothetical protein GW916_09305 [bacterium]|nr:hypothetical protein [bacterium]
MKIVISDVNEVCALSMERTFISFFGKDNLANLTDGGEGTSGRVPTKEQRQKCSISNKGIRPEANTVRMAIEKNSKPVGTTCGLRFLSAAHAARSLFPDNIQSAKSCISASCRGNKVSSALGYEFRFLDSDGSLIDSGFKKASIGKPVVRSDGVAFPSAKAATDDLIANGCEKAQNGNIIQCCKGRVQKAYGFSWRYAE